MYTYEMPGDDRVFVLHTDHLACIAELEGEKAGLVKLTSATLARMGAAIEARVTLEEECTKLRGRAMTDEQLLFLEEMVCEESPTRHDVLEGVFDIVQKEYPRVSAELVKLRKEVVR